MGKSKLAAVDSGAAREAHSDRQLLDSIVENLPDMVFVKDAEELRFVRFNRAGERLLGFSREDMIGKNDYDFFPKDEADFFTAKDREVLADGEMVEISEEPIHTRHLGTRVLHTKKIPIVDDDGEPRYLLGISEDITDRKEREAELRRLNERLAHRGRELEESVTELESVCHAISHDLRAPLRGIDGFCHLLLDEYEDALDDRGRDALRRVRGASQRMGELIDGLLGLARLNRIEPRREAVDLSAMAHTIGEDLCLRDADRSIDFEIEPDVVAIADHALLYDLLERLLENAWKFTNKRSRSHVAFGTCDCDEGKAYFVRDNGVGFDPAFSDQLYRSFQRLHVDDGYAGSGLGLATAARIVRRHGGRIWSESRPDAGATFYFTL